MTSTTRSTTTYETIPTTRVTTPDRRQRETYILTPTSPLTTVRSWFFFFFFQAEDGIRDLIVTGVQTCAPISDWWNAVVPAPQTGAGAAGSVDPGAHPPASASSAGRLGATKSTTCR